MNGRVAGVERELYQERYGEPDGWIVRMADQGFIVVAADPTAREALALAREIGHGDDRQASRATAAELDSELASILPAAAMGIDAGAAPWWRDDAGVPLTAEARVRAVAVAGDGLPLAPADVLRLAQYLPG